jgi:hypothetical protein
MSRIFLILLLGILVVVISPPLRSRAEPHVRFALNPLYEWTTRNRVTDLYNELESEKSLGRSLPTPRNFIKFVEQKDPGGGGAIDAWGNPYYLEATRKTFRVGSNGPDGLQGTADDIYSDTGMR